MQVYLCEKPSQGQDVARVLGLKTRGNGFYSGGNIKVTWCFGHLLEAAPPESYGAHYKKWTLTSLPILPSDWKMEVKKSTAKQLSVVKNCLAKATSVVIATDADREGEAIAREVLELCRFKGPVSRLWFSALDDASIKKAIANPIADANEKYPLYLAAKARARADWLVGMNLTRLFTLLGQNSGYDGVLSVGRVQTPTLKLVVDRDLEIEAFNPKPYWEVVADFEASGQQFKSKWVVPEEQGDEAGRCVNKAAATEVCNLVQNQQAQLVKLTEKHDKKAAPLLFNLGGLQQEASRRWGMGMQEVLDIAQALYETHKLTTYPRTDCGYLPKSMLSEVQAVAQALIKTDSAIQDVVSQADFNQISKAWNDKNLTAHHGIIPTMTPGNLSKLSDAELKVYDLIRRRYLAQFYPHYEVLKTDAEFSCAGHKFVSKGSAIIALGWKALFAPEKREATLPKMSQGDFVAIADVSVVEEITKPLDRFTEGTLGTAMMNAARYVENEQLKKMLRKTIGIATDSTRASVVQTLFQRGYLKKQGKHIISTDTARSLIAALPAAVKDPGTTALWEQALEEIAEGQRNLDEFMQRQEAWITQVVNKFSSATLNIKAAPVKACPECKKPMRKRKSVNGQFWGCSGYPDCKTTIAIGGANKKKSFSKKK